MLYVQAGDLALNDFLELARTHISRATLVLAEAADKIALVRGKDWPAGDWAWEGDEGKFPWKLGRVIEPGLNLIWRELDQGVFRVVALAQAEEGIQDLRTKLGRSLAVREDQGYVCRQCSYYLWSSQEARIPRSLEYPVDGVEMPSQGQDLVLKVSEYRRKGQPYPDFIYWHGLGGEPDGDCHEPV